MGWRWAKKAQLARRRTRPARAASARMISDDWGPIVARVGERGPNKSGLKAGIGPGAGGEAAGGWREGAGPGGTVVDAAGAGDPELDALGVEAVAAPVGRAGDGGAGRGEG